MDLGIDGRTALVTGSYRGTGAGIASALAAEGAHVIVHAFEGGQADGTVARIVDAGGNASAVVADIRSDEGMADLRDQVDSVDIVVNNYGAPMKSGWTSMDDWASEWNVNMLAGVRVTQLCLPAMKARAWGRVIFVGTVGTRQPGTRNPGYYAAKSGLHAMVRTLAMEVRGSGITANLVSPGMIATDEVRAMLTQRAAKRDIGPDWTDIERWGLDNGMSNLTERIAAPDDIGRIVAFVASEPAWHINGADLAVDGGAIDAS